MTRRAIGVSERPPLLQTIPLSLQHLFAMFGATVLVPVLFHINPATVLLFNGIGTLLYLFICKGKIPAYLGSSFAFISPVLLLLPLGYEVALGGFIMCGVLFCLVSFIVKKAGTGWLDVLFPPAAMGAIVAVIGLELAGVAAGMAGLLPAEGQTPDSKTIIISITTLAVTVLGSVLFRGFLAIIPILSGSLIRGGVVRRALFSATGCEYFWRSQKPEVTETRNVSRACHQYCKCLWWVFRTETCRKFASYGLLLCLYERGE